ncbi:hypothetical protein [Flavobacterium sp.]|uniref:hypothetical protein n=1 Tax=Flavobacterium sp. TaxID=239 RepID=UPI0025BF6F28|nr:hypothetical protein [Flavobacterium sp.]
MTEDFITYKRFNNINSAEEFGQLLKKEKIEYVIENNSLSLDATLTGNAFGNEFCVKIDKSQLKVVDEILLKKGEEDIEEVPNDYYLLSFSDDELIDVITKSDEWNTFDVALSKKLLKEKGKEITPADIEEIKNKRLEQLAKPEKSQKTYIIAGYIFAILGGLLSLFIGWHLLTYKKTLPNGDKVYAYSENDRKQGNRIFILGIVFLIIWLLYCFLK